MYIKLIHILIEQGLQNIGVFAYADMLPEELDIHINKRASNMIDADFDPIKNGQVRQKNKIQAVLDRFQNLHVKDFTQFTSPLINGLNYYPIPLAPDYIHLISDSSYVIYECGRESVTSGNIKAGKFYKVKGTKSVIYNSITYGQNSIFLGMPNITGYTFTGLGNLLLIELRSVRRPNRLIEEELLDNVLQNELEKTNVESPVSSLSGNILYVYVDDFTIDKVYQTYIRKPKPVNIKFRTYLTGTTLTIGNKYESINQTISYNGTNYGKFEPFTVVTGVTTFIGGGTIREFQDGDLEFTDSMSYTLVDAVVKDLAILSEQSQQKIVNLAQNV